MRSRAAYWPCIHALMHALLLSGLVACTDSTSSPVSPEPGDGQPNGQPADEPADTGDRDVVAPDPPDYRFAFVGEHRGRGTGFIGYVNGPEPTLIVDAPASVSPGSWSADGSRLLFSSDHEDPLRQFRHIYILDVASDSVLRLTESADFYRTPRWSPDESTVAVWAATRLVLIGSDSTARELMKASGQVRTPVWAPDGQRLAFAQRDIPAVFGDEIIGSLQITTVDGATSTVDAGACLYGDPDWSPDGRLVFSRAAITPGDAGYVISPGLLWLVEADGSQRELGLPVQSPRWVADGSRILGVTGDSESTIITIDPETGMQQLIFESADQVSYPSFSPDGVLLSFFRGSFGEGSFLATLAGGDPFEVTITGDITVRASAPVLWAPVP